jgi:SPP1 gp7 family putative phage head morphogenesis protein
VSGAGLQALLGQADVQISGFSDTMLTRLGNALAQGLAAGDSTGTISASIQSTFDDVAASQADLIAVTEVARAQTAGTIDAYNDSGIGRFDLITEADACPVCLDVESDNPHDVDDSDAQPPIHPRCRCAVTAVITTGASSDETDDSSDDES